MNSHRGHREHREIIKSTLCPLCSLWLTVFIHLKIGISVGILCAIDSNSATRFIHALIDRGDFIDPAPALRMIEIHHRFRLPVEVIGHERYLLIQLLEGVA
jgi:hypothetical protein